MTAPAPTRHQLRVLALLGNGHDTHAIATRVGLTGQGVASLLHRTAKALGVRYRAQAVAVAELRGLLVRDEAGLLAVAPPEAPPLLTPRRLEVLRHAANGRTNAEIARGLGLSVDTVKDLMRRIYAALGARDRAHAVAVAMVRGLIHPREIDLPQPTPGQPPDGALCGMPHHRYPASVCGKPAGHDRPPLPHRPTPHAAVLVIGGRECGSVAWGPDDNPPKETAR